MAIISGMSTELSPDKAQLYEYTKPDTDVATKLHVNLCRTDSIKGSVQVVGEEGANNLHSHKGQDGMWFVLSGRARFYTAGDEVIGEFGTHEGVLTPRGFPYWFESIGEEDLEILRVGAYDKEIETPGRVDHEGEQDGRSRHFDGRISTLTDPRKR